MAQMKIRGTTQIIAGTVDTAALGSTAVTTAKIAAGAVTTTELGATAVTTAKIAAGAVTTTELGADSVTAAKIADDVVNSEHLAAGGIDAEHFAAGAVDTTALGADAVTGAKIADNAVDSEHMTAGSVDNAHLAGSIATSKLSDSAEFVMRDGSVALTGDLSTGGNKITDIPTPTSNGDATPKIYVDGLIQGLRIKDSVRLATAAALAAYTVSAGDTLTADANGALTIDGVAVADDDRVLIKDESGGNAKYNGWFVVTDKGGASTPFILDRATDADTAAELAEGSFCWVSLGTANANTRWAVSTAPATLNTNDVGLTQISGAAELTAGAGMTKSGDTFDVVSGNGGIVVNADDITLTLDGGTLAVGGSGIKVSSGGITSTEIAADAVGSSELADNAVDTAAIASDAVTTAKIADLAVTTAKIAAGAVDTDEIADDAVDEVILVSTAFGDGLTGGSGTVISVDIVKEATTGTIDGANTAFTVTTAPFSENAFMLFQNGMMLREGGGNDYTRSAAAITMITAPPTGDYLEAVYLK